MHAVPRCARMSIFHLFLAKNGIKRQVNAYHRRAQLVPGDDYLNTVSGEIGERLLTMYLGSIRGIEHAERVRSTSMIIASRSALRSLGYESTSRCMSAFISVDRIVLEDSERDSAIHTRA